MAAKKTAGFKGPFKAAKSNIRESKSKTVIAPKVTKKAGKKHDCGCGGM